MLNLYKFRQSILIKKETINGFNFVLIIFIFTSDMRPFSLSSLCQLSQQSYQSSCSTYFPVPCSLPHTHQLHPDSPATVAVVYSNQRTYQATGLWDTTGQQSILKKPTWSQRGNMKSANTITRGEQNCHDGDKFAGLLVVAWYPLYTDKMFWSNNSFKR